MEIEYHLPVWIGVAYLGHEQNCIKPLKEQRRLRDSSNGNRAGGYRGKTAALFRAADLPSEGPKEWLT